MNAFQAAAAACARRLDVASRLADGRVRVTVRDYGPGIAESDCARLFTPFFSTKEEGMGLVLSICRSIISQHAGHIQAMHAMPGSTFSFDLPAVAVEPADAG